MSKRNTVFILIAVCTLVMIMAGFAYAEDFNVEEKYARENPAGWVRSNEFTVDSSLLLGGDRSAPHSIFMHSTETGDGVALFDDIHDGQVWDISAHPSGDYFASGSSDGTVAVWKADDGTVLDAVDPLMEGENVIATQFSPDGNYIVSGANDDYLRLWEFDEENGTIEEIASVENPSGANHIYGLDWSPDGNYIAAGREDTLVIFDAENLEIVDEIEQHGGIIRRVAYSPDGEYIARAADDPDDSGILVIMDANNYDDYEVIQGETGNIYGLAWSPDSKYLATGCNDNQVKFWDAETLEVLATKNQGATILQLSWSLNGKYVGTGNSGEQMKRLYKVSY